MPDTVIADTSSLILFDKIDRLDLLEKVYSKLHITYEIKQEFDANLPDWIVIRPVKNQTYQSFLETQLDKGEASAIALAHEIPDSLLILDDLKARKFAHLLNLRITGVLGVIHKAKQLKIISAVRPVIEQLMATNFRISDKIVLELLKINNEL